MAWNLIWIVFVVCLAACVVGFKKFVWFMSIGYGFAVAAGAIAIALIFRSRLTVITVIMLVLFEVYGIRLSGFLAVRELKNASYRRTLDEATKTEKPMPFFVLALMWLFLGALYTIQLSPVFYRLYNGVNDIAVPVAGTVISACGILLEAAADRQKSAQKANNPNMVATEGLYRIVRCPNYLGEIIFWTGVLIGSLTALRGAGQWFFAVFAWVCILVIMFNGAQRLEKRQNSRYGTLPEYQAYVKKTPILIPFVPIYSLTGKGKKS